jgi:hypothetical protein
MAKNKKTRHERHRIQMAKTLSELSLVESSRRVESITVMRSYEGSAGTSYLAMSESVVNSRLQSRL